VDRKTLPVGADGADPDSVPAESGSSRRKLVEIRCGFAELARREAETAELRSAEARRLFDGRLAVLNSARAAMDPGVTRLAKEEAHRVFQRAARDARSRLAVEEAASAWLNEINRVNAASRSAQLRIQMELDASDSAAAELDRLTAIAESSRAMAVSAAEACRSAQSSLSETEGPEAAASAADPVRGATAEMMSAHAAAQTAAAQAEAEESTTPVPALRTTSSAGVAGTTAGPEGPLPVELGGPFPPAIVALLDRDEGTLNRMVASLAGADPALRERWHRCLTRFVEAVVAATIENTCFSFPPGNPFWDQFTPDERCEIAAGLAALGFRFDGSGGFVDERVPGRHDLTLAVGQAGILVVRVRFWPNAEQAAALFRDVRVDTVGVLSQRAPGLTMAELIVLLGHRAAGVADLWNDWPRAQSLLLAPSAA
jgi:hypothetical protein